MELWPTREEGGARIVRLEGLLVFAAILGLFALAGSWWIAAIHHRGQLTQVRSPGAISALDLTWLEIAVVSVFTALLFALLIRFRTLVRGRNVAVIAFAMIGTAIAAFYVSVGVLASIAVSVFAGALIVGLHLGRIPKASSKPPSDRTIAIVLFMITWATYSVFAIHRYQAFGAGSWDLGCLIHIGYRTSRFLDTTSTVLGEVNFLGDHFQVGFYLFAPLYWISPSGTMFLLVHSASLAAVAPAIYLIARDKEVDRTSAAGIAISTAFAFGMQSAVYFDAHEITAGVCFFAFAIWAFERKQYRLATLFLFTFALFKESIGAYVAAIGLLAIVRGLRARERSAIAYGATWVLGGAIWFVLVNRLFMPTLVALGNAPEPHETFADFGPTVLQAAIGIVTHPLKAAMGIFVPDEKLASLSVTFGGLGYFAFFSPEISIAALPLLAERFLSSKSTMWEMGYHYAAPLTIEAGWAVAIGWHRAVRFLGRIIDFIGPGLASRVKPVALIYLLGSAIAINSVGYRHPANFWVWNEGYFSNDAKRAANGHAVDLVDRQGRDARVAVQDRILPHLADRAFIYRIGDWAKTDWVVLSIGESSWPYDNGFPLKLARDLAKNPTWKLVLSEGSTAVFARKTATELPEVQPTPELPLR